MSDVNDLQPGPELDRLVAEAIGWDSSFHDWQEIGCGHIDSAHECIRCRETYFGDALEYEAGKECVPKFSADWCAAMEAAERCGLFQNCYLKQTGTTWIVRLDKGDMQMAWRATTGPHAISLAILKIHPNTP